MKKNIVLILLLILAFFISNHAKTSLRVFDNDIIYSNSDQIDEFGEDIPSSTGQLLTFSLEVHEVEAQTKEESSLGLLPLRGTSTKRPYWLYIPPYYDYDNPPPLLIVLHRRGRLRSFSQGKTFGNKDLLRFAKADMEIWRNLAEQKRCLLVLPLGDVDILNMGLSWQTREHTKLINSLLESVDKTHPFDNSRVYIVAQGEGAHATLATAIRQSDKITAIALANPPLFDGESRIDWGVNQRKLILPEPISDMLENANNRKLPIYILAGNVDEKLNLEGHSISNIQGISRYQDTGTIPVLHLKKMAEILMDAGYAVKLSEIPVKHIAPFPQKNIFETWEWLIKNQIITE